MHPVAEQLASGFTRHFWSADQEIKWTRVETEYARPIGPKVLLVGKIDAEGITERGEGDAFFGDWKTIKYHKQEYMDMVKASWQMSPQALTYGLLKQDDHVNRFTVRWAIKPYKKDGQPTYTHEWYTFSPAELEWWKAQLLGIAQRIRQNRHIDGQWPVNLASCFKFGQNYACPFFADGCSKLKFARTGQARVPHLAVERELDKSDLELVVLDSSRIETWFECEEKYRRLWEGPGESEESEALAIGTDFHEAIVTHIQSSFIRS